MKNLTGYFLDKRMNVLGLVSSTIPNALRLESDNEFESIEEGITIFEGVVSYYGADEAGSDFVKVGNYFLYEDEDGICKAYTIIDTEKDRKRNEISFYAEDAGLSLLNSYTFPYEAVKDMTIASYFELFLKGSGFEIGTNELGDAYSRKLKWEGNATITERLLSVATQFDHADINFSFVVKGMRVTEKYVNIYKKRGIATNVTLQLNREIDNIITSESIKNLATSVLAKGGTPEGKDKPITLKGYVPKVPDERFFIEGEFLRDRDSNEIWSSFFSEGEGAKGGYIEKPFDYDTLSKEELYNRSVNHLKRVSQIEQNFEVDIALLPDNVRIGDTIQIIDQEDNLYLQARVLKMEKSRSLDKYVATLGEYLIKESGINQRLQELADRIAAIPRGATDYLWIRYADDNKGNGFSAIPTNKAYMAIKHVLNQPVPSDDPKDYEGLWVLIQGEKGIPGEPGDDGLPTYTWIRYADNVAGGGISANPQGKMYIGFAYNKLTPEPSNTPKDYAWILAKGEDGKNGSDGKDGVNGLPGADGKPTYTWIKYANGANGEGMTESPTSSTFFIGIAVNKLVQAESSNPSDYTWSKFVGEDGDDGVPGKPGADGKPTYTWMKYADTDKGTGMSNSPAGKDYIGFAYNKATAAESNVATDYIWSLIKGEDGKNGLSITSVQSLFYQSTSATSLVDGTWVTTAPTWESGKFSWTKTKTVFSDSTSSETVPVNITGGIGKDGKPTYTWIRYADNVSGGGISANPQGKMYIGFAYNKPTPTPSNIPKDYAWSAMYDEAKMLELNKKISVIEEQTSEISKNLDLIVVPVMQPNRPLAKEGMVWWKTDVKGDVIGIEKYIRGRWEKQIIQQDTLNIINLNAVKITGSEITGTEIAGSTIISTFDEEIVPGSPVKRRGTLKLDKGSLSSDFEYYNINRPSLVTAKGNVRVSSDGLRTAMYDAQGNVTSASRYSDMGISINNPSMPYGSVNLGYEDLLTIRPARLIASADWSVYATEGNSEPLGSRQGRLVSLSGAFKPTKVLRVTGISEQYVMGVLPVGLRPERAVYSVQLGSGTERYRLGIFPDGRIIADRNIGQNGYTDFRLGGWYTINTSFSAANT